MKKYLSGILIVFVIIALIFTYITENSFAAATEDDKAPENKAEAVAASASAAGTLENVLFAKLPGKERVHLVVSKQPLIDVKNKVNGSYLIRLEDMVVPENLCRPLGEGELNNIISVVPSRQLIKGKEWVYLNININKVVPYSIRQEDQNILIDFNVSGLRLKTAEDSPKTAAVKKVVAKVSAAPEKTDVIKNDGARDIPVKRETARKQTDRIISLDFQEADIKSVLRLMAEYGNVSIVSSDEVKGNITLSMKNVPWSKALDTILDLNSLTKREEDNVIVVTTQERRKKDYADKLKAIDDENERKNKERSVLAEKGLLKQVLIEAKIVEATEEFIRNIGVQWGFGNQQKVSGGTYGLGVTGGSNPVSTNTYSQVYPSEIGIKNVSGTSLAMAAVNFPMTVASPAIGLVFGGATGFLEAQLAALESNTTGKIISAPKVVTMDGIKAVIRQGEEVPYTTPASGTSPATVSFKSAALELEVTPKITAEGKISMDIKASNDVPNYAMAATLQGNPPIRTSKVESKVIINDGDTVVVGGIYKSTEDISDSGWPWLQKIPVLGFLFKTNTIDKTKKQLLIFVTPRILKSDYVGENPDKILIK